MSIPKQYRYSAILINYNHAHFLPQAFAGLRGQEIEFDEIIVCDDCSTDDSIKVIKRELADLPQARLVQNPQNLGVVETLNRILPEATGDFIFYMSADDTYSSRIIPLAEEVLARFPDVAMIAGNARLCHTTTGAETLRTLPFPPEIARYTADDVRYWAKRTYFTFLGGAIIFRREALLAAGGQHAELKWNADWFLYLILSLRYPFAVVPEVLVNIRIAADQYSAAFYDWRRQRLVIEAFIALIKRDYPAEYGFFREHAVLPSYDLQAVWLFLHKKELRGYVTPLLLWRLLTYKPLRVVGRLFPAELRQKLRRMARV